MMHYYKTINGKLTPIENYEEDCWVSVQQPTFKEVEILVDELGINEDFIETSLDENERSHIEIKDEQQLIIFDMPVEMEIEAENAPEFFTVPIGFILTKKYTVSIIGIPSPIIDEAILGKLVNSDTLNHNQFIFSIIYNISQHFVMHLDNIDRVAFGLERKLQTSTKNEELIQLLSLQKSLVYFTTSLKATEATLEKLLRGKVIDVDDEDKELLSDTLIEIKQSIENANIYTEVLASTVDVVSSIINNNMNIVMKALTSITIVLSIPTMIFGFYGMNVYLGGSDIHYGVPVALTLLITGGAAFLLYRNNFF